MGVPNRNARSAVTRAPAPALVERFRADLLRLLRAPLLPDDRLALAVSGGADSMAMLVLAHAAFPGQAIACTVDHRLRAESAGEAAMVAAHCAALGVPHRTFVPGAPISGSSIQARARAVRYEILSNWAQSEGAEWLLTAHHADDQAETFLMRAARGSGVSGLASIRVRRELIGDASRDLSVVRPLLQWRRAELRALAETTGTPFVDDPSNTDPRHDRARFRRMIEDNAELDVQALAGTATYAAEAEQALADVAEAQWTSRAVIEGARVRLDMTRIERAFSRRLARRAIGEVRRIAFIESPPWSDAANIEALLDALEMGKGATKAGVKASVHGAHWRFEPAPPRRSH